MDYNINNIFYIINIYMDLVLKTVYFSIFMQVLTGLIQMEGMFIKLPPHHSILTSVLRLETMVQFIEASFYVWLLYNFKNIKKMASKRYYDWMITTPAMLLATIMYMKYLEKKSINGDLETDPLKFGSFVVNNKDNIIKLFISNALMLALGFMGEIGKMNIVNSVIVGMVFFLYTFYLIWDQYAKYTQEGTILFYFLFVVWGLYAVAALMKPKMKNVGYNLLDIVSKNFYGLYIYYVIKSI